MNRIPSTPARLALLLGILCASLAASAQPYKRTHPAEITFFAPDDENRGFDAAEPPSDAVLDALLKTPEAKDARVQLAALDREKLRSLFQVVPINLGSRNETDYIELGSLPLSGADCFWFWLIRPVGSCAQVILFANALTLQLLPTRSHGYRDICSTWGSAAGYTITGVLHFTGAKYILTHQYTRKER